MSAFTKALFLGNLAVLIACSSAFAQFGNTTTKPQIVATPIKAPRELRVHLDRAKKALADKDYQILCQHINELLKKSVICLRNHRFHVKSAICIRNQ